MRKIAILCTLFVTVLAGCSENCCQCNDCDNASGNFRLIRDLELWHTSEKPGELDVCFYSKTQAPIWDKLSRDTNYYNIPAGDYQILIINRSQPATYYTGLDNYYSAQASLPVQIDSNTVTTCEASLHISSYLTAVIAENGITEYTVQPAPINKIINFSVHVESNSKVTGCQAILLGVQTSVMLCTSETVASPSAQLPFQLSPEKENSFYKRLSLFGLTPGAVILTLQFSYEGGTQETQIDISDKISFVSPVQDCTINITIDKNLLHTDSVEISDWLPGTSGSIELI